MAAMTAFQFLFFIFLSLPMLSPQIPTFQEKFTITRSSFSSRWIQHVGLSCQRCCHLFCNSYVVFTLLYQIILNCLRKLDASNAVFPQKPAIYGQSYPTSGLNITGLLGVQSTQTCDCTQDHMSAHHRSPQVTGSDHRWSHNRSARTCNRSSPVTRGHLRLTQPATGD